MEKNWYHSPWPKAALFAASFIWGSSFVVMKNSVDVFPPFTLLAIRFALGCLILGVIFHRKFALLNREYLWKGCLLGLFLIAAYSIQTIGLTYTTPGKNAFLTAVYCVLVPFVFWLVNKERPDIYHLAAALICMTGIGMVSLKQNLTMGIGDGITLISGIFYAIHIVAVARFTKGRDVVLFTIIQFFAAAVIAGAAAVFLETPPKIVGIGSIGGILYLAVFATAGALLFQNIGQKYTNPSAASIVLSLESVFGILFSVILYHEKVTGRLLLGFALIFAAVLISETKLSFLKWTKPIVKQDSCE